MRQAKEWVWAAAVLLAATLAAFALDALGIERASLLMVFMVGVMCSASLTHGYRYSVTQAICSMLLFNFFFTEPVLTFKIDSRDDTILLFFFLITAFISAGMTARFQRALAISQANAQRAQALAEEKNRAVREAEEAQMKSNLLRSIGHDLRTPLTGIQCGSTYLTERAGALTAEEIRRTAADIGDQVSWLITMVENILYMTRLDSNRLEVNAQPEVIDDVVAEAVRHVPALNSRDFACVLPEHIIVAPMDGKMIVQVLVNLLDNAAKYTPAGGRVRLTAWGDAAQKRVWFAVEDSGCGVPPAQQQAIFDAFVTSGKIGPDGKKGMGLGLAICRAAVRAHHGEIRVGRSDTLGGAAFTFWLPTQEEQE